MVLFRAILIGLVMFIGVAASCNKNKGSEESQTQSDSTEEMAPTTPSDEYPADEEQAAPTYEDSGEGATEEQPEETPEY